MTKVALLIENQKPVLSIAHMASNTPFYYVEEAEIGHSKVSVSFFNENDPASEIETASIPTKELIDFVDEFYNQSSYHTVKWGEIVEENLNWDAKEYLKDNLKSVVTEFLNKKGVSSHA